MAAPGTIFVRHPEWAPGAQPIEIAEGGWSIMYKANGYVLVESDGDGGWTEVPED